MLLPHEHEGLFIPDWSRSSSSTISASDIKPTDRSSQLLMSHQQITVHLVAVLVPRNRPCRRLEQKLGVVMFDKTSQGVLTDRQTGACVGPTMLCKIGRVDRDVIGALTAACAGWCLASYCGEQTTFYKQIILRARKQP